MEPDRSGSPYPDAAEFAAHVASLYGMRRILDVGAAWSRELEIAYPGLSPLTAEEGSGRAATGAAILAVGAADPLFGPDGRLAAGGVDVESSPLIVIATDDAAVAKAWLTTQGLVPAFAGRTRLDESDSARSAHLFVVDRALDRAIASADPAPDTFRVVAIVAAYNEEDVIGPSIEKLIDDGVGVYVIDNWSTDRTAEIVRGFEGRGLVGSERFPATPDDRFALRSLLVRATEVAAGLEADWCVHHDADERRLGPWPGLGLRESLWRVDRAGFNAVDFTVANYRPIDNSYEPGSDFEEHFRNFEFGDTSDLLVQIKAWKNDRRVDLVGSAGHQARFANRRVFPYKFLLKHYPIRSQAHGERKIFRERIPRWDRHERVRGWHVHYDDFRPDQSFLRDPAELIEDRGEETWRVYMPEALTGSGLVHREFPEWALRGGAGRSFFLGRQAWERSAAAGLFREAVGKPRGLVRRVRRALAERG